MFLHFPAYYQVFKGGRLHLSYAEAHASMLQYRPEQRWSETVQLNTWVPQAFDYDLHAARFDYFLLRVPPDQQSAVVNHYFAKHAAELKVTTSGAWVLISK